MILKNSPVILHAEKLEELIKDLRRVNINLVGSMFQNRIEDIIESAFLVGFIEGAKHTKRKMCDACLIKEENQ
jgi:hypothetical protein